MKPIMKRLTTLAAATFVAASFTAPTQAAGSDQNWPTRPIEILVPSSPGGGTDMLARIFADVAKKYLAQPFVVSNKPGAGGGIAMTEVQRARPDGYKIAMLISELAIIPHLGMTQVTTRDFAPIAQLNGDPGLIAVRADAPWQTIDALLDKARSQPGTFVMGNSGTGTIWHLAATALEQRTGLTFNHVPFQGDAPSTLALLGGHVDAIVVSLPAIAPHVASGALRVLATMTEERLGPPYAEVPTFKEKGVDLVMGTWRGLGAPPGTPLEALTVLRKVAAEVSADPAFHQALAGASLMPAYRDADAFQTFMNEASASFEKLLANMDLQK